MMQQSCSTCDSGDDHSMIAFKITMGFVHAGRPCPCLGQSEMPTCKAHVRINVGEPGAEHSRLCMSLRMQLRYVVHCT